MSLATIPEVLDALRAGKPVIVADDEARENEGDAIMAAEFATQEWIAWMGRHTSGFLCAPMTNSIADRLEHLGDRGQAHAMLPAPATAGSASDDGSERCASRRSIRSTWRARMSVSRFTRSPGSSRPSVVAASVSGMSDTSNHDPVGSSPSALTVSELSLIHI